MLSSPYGKVASWLNSTYSSGAGNSIKPKPGSGPPLINRFSSSLLWYIGLGGALHHKQRLGQQQINTPQQAQQQQQAATSITSAASAPGSAAGQSAHTARAAAAPAHGLPVGQQGVLKSVTQGPASHPLTLQQLEQSLEFSTSSSSAGAAAAPVQAVTKGKAVHMCGPINVSAGRLLPLLHSMAGAAASGWHLHQLCELQDKYIKQLVAHSVGSHYSWGQVWHLQLCHVTLHCALLWCPVVS